MKYRKKPVVVEAYQTDKELDIETLEGTMHASVGDYIITGVRGEQYPCKPDIFEQTYEPADAPTDSPWHRVEVEEPTKAGWYLVMDEDGDFNVDEWHNTFGWQFVTPSDADRITHWMPIEPPKEDA